MADISKEINNFKTAIYGKDVRDSMVSMANKLNSEVESSTEAVQRYEEAEVLREQAENDRQNAENSRTQEFLGMQQSSQQATNAANEAAEKAEKYVLGDISEKTVTFQMAAERANIQSNDNLAVAFAKLSKFCSDLQEHAFNALVNNGLTTETGKYALDAAYGKLLRDDIDKVNLRLSDDNFCIIEKELKDDSYGRTICFNGNNLGIATNDGNDHYYISLSNNRDLYIGFQLSQSTDIIWDAYAKTSDLIKTHDMDKISLDSLNWSSMSGSTKYAKINLDFEYRKIINIEIKGFSEWSNVYTTGLSANGNEVYLITVGSNHTGTLGLRLTYL